jgi:hypothetical protein
MRPATVNILGKTYTISYVDRPSDVDVHQKESLWGQISYWERSIRIYDNGRTLEDIWHSILHEVLHGIANSLNIKILTTNETDIDLLALALTDVFFRNNWLDLDAGGGHIPTQEVEHKEHKTKKK